MKIIFDTVIGLAIGALLSIVIFVLVYDNLMLDPFLCELFFLIGIIHAGVNWRIGNLKGGTVGLLFPFMAIISWVKNYDEVGSLSGSIPFFLWIASYLSVILIFVLIHGRATYMDRSKGKTG